MIKTRDGVDEEEEEEEAAEDDDEGEELCGGGEADLEDRLDGCENCRWKFFDVEEGEHFTSKNSKEYFRFSFFAFNFERAHCSIFLNDLFFKL